MALNVRRVVTGHDDNGKAVVEVDEQVTNVVSSRPKTEASVIWTTQGFPVNNDGFEERNGGASSTTLAGGTVFRVLRLEPGNTPRVHRTDSIDYAVIMEGEIDMELEEGEFIHLKQGDVLVQRGTVHNWVNRGSGPCTIAFILIDAKRVEVNGKLLEAHG
jgi:quercetin dioxygenase-like cupin family protein